MAVIYCFGDSITYGEWDIEKSGWVGRLRDHLDDLQLNDHSLYFLAYNLGIPGETTDGLVKRFERELEARERDGEEVIFIFAFGANDSVFLPSKKGFKVSKERFVLNLQTVIDSAGKISKKIILVNITPVDEALYSKRFGADERVRSNSYIEEYNSLIIEIAKKNSISLIDTYSAYMQAGYKILFSEDGLHPNEKGHQLIFEKVKDALAL